MLGFMAFGEPRYDGGGVPVADRQQRLPEIKAKVWLNASDFRLNDERDAVVLFFSRKDDEKALGEMVRRLAAVALRPDTDVVALTADGRAAARRFVERYRVKFAVGAGSRSARDFNIRRTPALVRIKRKGGDPAARVEAVTPEQLAHYLPRRPGKGDTRGRPVAEQLANDPAEWSKRVELWEVVAYLRSDDQDYRQRSSVVSTLYERMPTADFIALADDVLAGDEDDPFVRNHLEYYRLLAQGRGGDPDVQFSAKPIGYFYSHMSENPRDPAFARARAYVEEVERRSAEQLVADYWQHRGDAPEELVIRMLAVERLTDLLGEQGLLPSRVPVSEPQVLSAAAAAARHAYMEMLLTEPDWCLRTIIAGKLPRVCLPVDVEAADFLEALAVVEPNFLHARPTMQHRARFLRSGQQPRQ